MTARVLTGLPTSLYNVDIIANESRLTSLLVLSGIK